jgi:hypothetical protein
MKDLILLLSHLLAQHGWIKYVLEITLLTLGAGVVRVGTLRERPRRALYTPLSVAYSLEKGTTSEMKRILLSALLLSGSMLAIAQVKKSRNPARPTPFARVSSEWCLAKAAAD